MTFPANLFSRKKRQKCKNIFLIVKFVRSPSNVMMLSVNGKSPLLLMNHLCGFLRSREDVAVFDNGLRIESEVRILNHDKVRFCKSDFEIFFKFDGQR